MPESSPNMTFSRPYMLIIALLAAQVCTVAIADITQGVKSDFEDGTTQGWQGNSAPTNIATGGPDGAGDNFLQIGGGNRFATYNATVPYTGLVDSDVIALEVDLMRPASDVETLPMRIVLFGPGPNVRWTSAVPQVVPNDGVWRRYIFSVLEGDLIRVLGSGSYNDLISDVDRTMLRYDPDPPSSGGQSVGGTLGIDNVAFFGDLIFSTSFD